MITYVFILPIKPYNYLSFSKLNYKNLINMLLGADHHHRPNSNLRKLHSSIMISNTQKNNFTPSYDVRRSDITLLDLGSEHNKIKNNRVNDSVEYELQNNEQCLAKGDSENLLTPSSLSNSGKRLHYILKNKSQELQTDDSSNASLESNIKFFKTAVQEIFDNFYNCMNDFELYKKRYYEILSKTREDSIAEMEEFIKDMIQHIISNESMSSDAKKVASDLDSDMTKIYSNAKVTTESYFLDTNIDLVKEDCAIGIPVGIETNNMKFDDVHEEFTVKCNNAKLFVTNTNLNERHLHSDLNFKTIVNYKVDSKKEKQVASAENFVRIAEKRLQLQEYYLDKNNDTESSDRDIPVKNSCGMNNIHLKEKEANDNKNENGSFNIIYRFCNYLCKRFRKI